MIKKLLHILSWLLQPLNRVTGRRWADILLLGIIGGTLCVLLLTPFKNTGVVNYWLTDRLWDLADCIPGRDNVLFFECTLGFLLFFIVLAVFFGLFAALLAKLGALRWGHWKSFFLYPPVWLAGLWPLPIVSFFLLPRCRNTTTLLVAYGLIVISSTLALLIRSFLTPTCDTKIKRHKGPEPTPPTSKETLEKFAEHPEELIEWLKNDDPVEKPDQDLFEYIEYARRIGELLTQHQLASIALVGPFGIGKTTVLNLLDYLLPSTKFQKEFHDRWRNDTIKNWRIKLQPPKIYTCRVEAWGLSSLSATEAILGEIVNKLSEHVDCFALRKLPKEYVSAIQASSPKWLHGLISLASFQSPQDMVDQIDPLLEAINARLIVYLEDVDRNFRSEEKYLEVEALLDKMKELSRVSFVLAINR